MSKHLFFLLFIIFSIILTGFQINLRGEQSFIEVTQVLILLTGLIVTIKNRKKLIKFYNSYSYYLKIVVFVFLLYEENSYLTSNKSDFFNLNNLQSEINLHNSKYFLMKIVENIHIPFLNYSFTLTLSFIVFNLIFALLGYGMYIKSFKNFRLLFLEKKYSIYTFLFFVDTIIGSIIRNFTSNSVGLIEQEALELFFYIILLIDLSDKVYKKNF